MELKKKIEIAQEILKQAMEISKNTEHDVFFEWAAHVNWIDINIYRGGWERDKTGAHLHISFDAGDDTSGELANALAVLDSLQDKK